MCNKEMSVPSEAPSADKPTIHSSGIKKFGKKLYVIAAIIVIAVIATAILIPQGLGNSIPLSLNYQVGEKMIYNTTETASQTGETTSPTVNSNSSIEVVDFDGETYTLNHTITVMLDNPISVSISEKVNKTGYANYFLPGETENLFGNTSSNPILSTLLSKPEAKVGDTWQIPLNTGNSTIGTTGNLTLTFIAIQDITVPAGTYKVFRLDVACDNLVSYAQIPENASVPGSPAAITTSSIDVNFRGHIYLEYGTCRQIKSDIQMAMAVKSTVLNSNISYSSQMTLVQHIKP